MSIEKKELNDKELEQVAGGFPSPQILPDEMSQNATDQAKDQIILICDKCKKELDMISYLTADMCFFCTHCNSVQHFTIKK